MLNLNAGASTATYFLHLGSELDHGKSGPGGEVTDGFVPYQ